MASEGNKPVIYYIYDALCGWCYGFSPVISEFFRKNRDNYEFQVLSGGMVTGEQEGPVNEVAGYIRDAYRNVEQTTGIEFGKAFLEGTLEEGTAYFSSVPAALAMALFRTQRPEEMIPFATRIQKAIYYDGLPPAEVSTFGECARDFNMDAELFQQRMTEPAVQNLVQQEFHVVARWGVRGFPSVVYKDGDQAFMISRGYSPLSELEQTFANVRAEIARKKSDF
ncbi:MAG TPA: protein-disulfide isomerase [Cryomorphaceae bacterium]|nr:protein-disulfide isomerase [Owenweeksia sp.]HAD96272.1 protein-disulfide isomerase [Cryomorphaceae bacterium]HBF19695.1 protein-disulfide isomerase [Cryomorphaceae bacterium]HCQ16544.1 protein-disulfide isomerase [Cryomorphaceae bacterium]